MKNKIGNNAKTQFYLVGNKNEIRDKKFCSSKWR